MSDQSDSPTNAVREYGGDILESERFAKAYRVPHHNEHGNIGLHSLETAGYATAFARWLRQRGYDIDVRDVVRASLLHDIGMTEDEVFESPSRQKAFSHPREGVRIARDEFDANEEQLDAISHHMWPIGLTPPHNSTGWIVLAADKYCSMREVQREAARIARNVKDHFDRA